MMLMFTIRKNLGPLEGCLIFNSNATTAKARIFLFLNIYIYIYIIFLKFEQPSKSPKFYLMSTIVDIGLT